MDILGFFRRKPEQAVVESSERSDEALFPDGEPRALTRDDVAGQVNSIYSRLSESDKTRLLEDLWSRFEFDTPYSRTYTAEKLGVPGRFTLLREWTWPERMDVLERSHQAWERNPLAKTGVAWTTRFVVGTGGTLTYQAAEVKEVLDEFIKEPINTFDAYEREFCDVLQVDGEIWVRFFKNEQGKTVMIPIRPWHIHWITTDPDNYKDVKSYHYVYIIYRDQPGTSEVGTEDVDASEILHIGINRLPYELRGRPDLFVILPWLKAYRDWLEERARINRRKSVYYHVKLKNAQSGQVTAMQAKFKQPPAPGSIIVTNDNVEWLVLESNIRAGEASEDGRQIKLMAISGLQEPEYFFSDGANANLASATAQQLPALKKFSDYQDILVDQVWKPIFRRVIQNAVDAGRIPEVVAQTDSNGDPIKDDETGETKQLKAVEAFDYQYPQIEEKDPFNLAKALQLAMQQDLVSEETASAEMGFDYAKEQKKLEAEKGKRLEWAMNTPAGFTPDGKPLPPPKNGNGNAQVQGTGDGTTSRPKAKGSAPGVQPQIGDMGDRQLQPSASSPNYGEND